MSWHLELAFLVFVLLFITSHLHSATHSLENYEQKKQMSTKCTTQYLPIVFIEQAWKNATVVIPFIKEWWLSPCPQSGNLFV